MDKDLPPMVYGFGWGIIGTSILINYFIYPLIFGICGVIFVLFGLLASHSKSNTSQEKKK